MISFNQRGIRKMADKQKFTNLSKNLELLERLVKTTSKDLKYFS